MNSARCANAHFNILTNARPFMMPITGIQYVLKYGLNYWPSMYFEYVKVCKSALNLYSNSKNGKYALQYV